MEKNKYSFLMFLIIVIGISSFGLSLLYADTVLYSGLTPISGQTFLFTRPIFQSIAARTTLWHDAGFDTSENSGFRITSSFQTT